MAPTRWPASAWNGGRLHIGLWPASHRNTWPASIANRRDYSYRGLESLWIDHFTLTSLNNLPEMGQQASRNPTSAANYRDQPRTVRDGPIAVPTLESPQRAGECRSASAPAAVRPVGRVGCPIGGRAQAGGSTSLSRPVGARPV